MKLVDPAATQKFMSAVVKNISSVTGIPITWLFTTVAFLFGAPLSFSIWLAVTISDIKRDIREIKSDMWSEASHEYWALELQRQNPDLRVPLNPQTFQKKSAKN